MKPIKLSEIKINNVLWTGGWDSTFRIIDLVLKNAPIQPIYVMDSKRFSTQKELETIEKLTSLIRERYPKSEKLIHDLIIIDKKSIKKKILIKLSYKILKRKKPLGSQYYWLACLARDINNLELSVHADDFKHLKGNTILVKDHAIGDYKILNPDINTPHLKRVFSRQRFPIIGMKKLDMKKIAEQQGFIDILNETWFCHDSNSEPCGECNPCKQTIKDGMGYRITKS